MTSQQINETLAAWLSERTGKEWRALSGEIFVVPASGLQLADNERPPFTESLDSVRMVEDAMTDNAPIGERLSYYWALKDWSELVHPKSATVAEYACMTAPADVRARCAVKALGLEVASWTHSNSH